LAFAAELCASQHFSALSKKCFFCVYSTKFFIFLPASVLGASTLSQARQQQHPRLHAMGPAHAQSTTKSSNTTQAKPNNWLKPFTGAYFGFSTFPARH
jgi:hypothetical protein